MYTSPLHSVTCRVFLSEKFSDETNSNFHVKLNLNCKSKVMHIKYFHLFKTDKFMTPNLFPLRSNALFTFHDDEYFQILRFLFIYHLQMGLEMDGIQVEHLTG